MALFLIMSQILWVKYLLLNVKFIMESFLFSQSYSELLDSFRLSGLRWIWEILLFFLVVFYHFYIVCFADRMYFTMALVTKICKLEWRKIASWHKCKIRSTYLVLETSWFWCAYSTQLARSNLCRVYGLVLSPRPGQIQTCRKKMEPG